MEVDFFVCSTSKNPMRETHNTNETVYKKALIHKYNAQAKRTEKFWISASNHNLYKEC